MQDKVLFKDKNGGIITNNQIFYQLVKLGADRCDVLYIHTALSFGIPRLKKMELLEELYNIFINLNVPTLIVPTFTFSFPNNKDFDVENSKTPMGLFNEYFRQQNGIIRSIDPLMSNALLGNNHKLVTGIGKNSSGEDSTFDLLHQSELNVKFLFFGIKAGDCFTYMHFIEEKLKVPYRYSRSFTGKIINNGITYTDTYNLYVRYSNVFPGSGSYIYENILLERNIAKRIKVGDNQITIVPEKSAFTLYQDIIQSYPCFFISDPFNSIEKTTDFYVENMTAL